MRVRMSGTSDCTRRKTSRTIAVVAGPPGTTTSSTAAVRERRLLIRDFFFSLLALGGWSGATAAPTQGLDAFLTAVFSNVALPAGFPAGAILVGAGLDRRSGAAALLLAGRGGSALPPFPAFFLFLPAAPGVLVGATLTGGGLAAPGGRAARETAATPFLPDAERWGTTAGPKGPARALAAAGFTARWRRIGGLSPDPLSSAVSSP